MFVPFIRAVGRGIVAAFVLAPALLPAARADEPGSYMCPVLGSRIGSVTKDTLSSDYKGVRYYFCCASCKPSFDKNPDKYLKDGKKDRAFGDKIVGASLFDPVSTKRLDPERALAHSDYNGVRYFFATTDEKKTFDRDAAKLAAAPEKEVLFCPVSNEVVETYAKASDYSDLKGVRYYFCCAGCKPSFDKDPDKYLNGLDARIKAAAKPDKKGGQ